jgi:PAS domain S-box-containing protein
LAGDQPAAAEFSVYRRNAGKEMSEARTTLAFAGGRSGPLHIRALIVEHDRGDVDLMIRELRHADIQVEYEVAETREDFREKLRESYFDVVLADYRLPQWNGLEALDELKQSGKDIPFLLVTGTLGEEAVVECIKQGVSDHVLKGHLARLPVALERALEEKSLRDKHAHATAALRDSEASFRLLFAGNPLPMWVYDRETLQFLQVNDTAVKHYGYTREEFLGMRLTDIQPPEDAPKLLEYLKGHPESLGTTGPWRHWLKHGQLIEVEISQHPLPFAGRDAVLAVMVDLTERLGAEKALRESEARAREQFAELDLLYRTAPVGIAVFDSQFRHLRVNEQLARITGIPAEQHLGRTLREILPELADPVESMLRKVFEGGEVILNVETATTSTPAQPGVERHWLTNYFPLRAADGTIFAASVIVLEITDRKRAEQALRLSEARNRDLVENTTYGILRATAEGKFLDVNPALVRMLGFAQPSELCSQHSVQDVFRYPEQGAAFLASCRQEGRLSGVETEWRRKDGANIVVRLSGRMTGSAHEGNVLEVIAEDVTELRLMEKRLRQVQKFEAVGQLAGGVAHDFNNVVGAILGWAEIGMEQARKEPRLLEHFSKIREQADRAAALTRQLLAFARQQVLQPRAVHLNAVVSNLLSFLEKVIGQDVELKVIPAPALDLVRADPTQIEQVLMNLCLNARDAMPDGGRLLIETEAVEIDEAYCRYYSYASVGRYVVLSVSDTGCGMDAATRERIFEPFFTTKGLGKGTGLGLATVYGIVRQHGGFIHVYSEPGQGSLFRVYLPAISTATSSAVEKAPGPAVAAPLPRGTETILLAEDHDGIREIAQQTLANLGYRVLSAANGEEALHICENERPALAILDVVMPRLNGPGAYRKLQTRFRGLPVIFTTGYTAEQAALEKELQSGGMVLQKPYSPTTLGRLVRELLDRVALAAKPHD